jgi:hypothetical protein
LEECRLIFIEQYTSHTAIESIGCCNRYVCEVGTPSKCAGSNTGNARRDCDVR